GVCQGFLQHSSRVCPHCLSWTEAKITSLGRPLICMLLPCLGFMIIRGFDVCVGVVCFAVGCLLVFDAARRSGVFWATTALSGGRWLIFEKPKEKTLAQVLNDVRSIPGPGRFADDGSAFQVSLLLKGQYVIGNPYNSFEGVVLIEEEKK